MDAHVFRLIQAELLLLLQGARVEKIHGPNPDTTAFILFAHGKKHRLVLRHGRSAPLLFLTGERLENPLRPPAYVMRLRKYCQGRRLGEGKGDFTTRVLALPITSQSDSTWLLLDLAQGPLIAPTLPENFGLSPAWPDSELVDSLCGTVWNKKEKSGPWQQYSLLTPLLRETLAALDPLEGRALMADLEAGGGDLFFYTDRDEHKGKATFYSAWPLPQPVMERRGLVPLPAAPIAPAQPDGTPQSPCPLLTAVSEVDAPLFFQQLAMDESKEQLAPVKRETKKLTRLSQKLDQEETRLHAMLALREDAKCIQEVLWQYAPTDKLEEIRLPGALGQGEKCIRLNSLLSVRDNMLRMFKESARGKRGLTMLAQRRQQLFGEGQESRFKPSPETYSVATAAAAASDMASRQEQYPHPLPDDPAKPYRHVARFRSSDGFLLLRGKNAQGNHNVLKLAKGHDFWLHAHDGPSAHLIIRRAHAAEEVPETTLREAARLVWEKSWQRNDAKGNIMVAFARHVHSIKGASPGTVKVDAVHSTLMLNEDPPAHTVVPRA
ncbi:NFACT RNA binding domain-containing protein [Desulfovibrio sp. OttesenSCG-928-G15]|nr:NFACT RNA binding domain-containing protein [Desulfovibrio sp. OttesenSCG-928-G15]